MEYNLNISKLNHYKAALKIQNSFINLTDFELDLIVEMLNSKVEVLNTKNRRMLRDQLNTNVYTFNNYIKRLKDRGYLVEATGGLKLHDSIIAAANSKSINITINVT